MNNKLCIISTEQIEKEGIAPLQKLLDSTLPGWPILKPIDGIKKPNPKEFQERYAQFVGNTTVSALFDVDVEPDEKNTSVFIIHVSVVYKEADMFILNVLHLSLVFPNSAWARASMRT